MTKSQGQKKLHKKFLKYQKTNLFKKKQKILNEIKTYKEILNEDDQKHIEASEKNLGYDPKNDQCYIEKKIIKRYKRKCPFKTINNPIPKYCRPGFKQTNPQKCSERLESLKRILIRPNSEISNPKYKRMSKLYNLIKKSLIK